MYAERQTKFSIKRRRHVDASIEVLVACFSVQPLCPLCLCGGKFFYHGDTEDTEVAQRRAQCFIMAIKLSHDSSTDDLNVHDIKQG